MPTKSTPPTQPHSLNLWNACQCLVELRCRSGARFDRDYTSSKNFPGQTESKYEGILAGSEVECLALTKCEQVLVDLVFNRRC
jgi:hypothetical protein